MKVGLLADIHANLPALEAVLADLPSVDLIVCLGDIVGYNPWPEACVKRVREVADITVQGNHDRDINSPAQYADAPRAEAGLRHAFESLSADQRDWLTDLPRKATIEEYLLIHSHPDAVTHLTAGESGDSRELFSSTKDYAGIVFGHTHAQQEATVDGRLLINPGAVGEPLQKNAQAAYGVLNTDSQTVDLRRVEYDGTRVFDRCRERGLPTRSNDPLGRGI